HGMSILENPTTGQTPRGFRWDDCDWRLIDTLGEPAADRMNTSQAVIEEGHGFIALASFTFARIRRLANLFARITITIAVTFAVTTILRATVALRRFIVNQQATNRMLRQELAHKTSRIHILEALYAAQEEASRGHEAEKRRLTRSQVEAFLLHVRDRTNLQAKIKSLQVEVESSKAAALARVNELEAQVDGHAATSQAHGDEARRLQESVSRLSKLQIEGVLLHIKDRSELRSTINDFKRKMASLESENRTALMRVRELELREAGENIDRILLAIERSTVGGLQEQLSVVRAERDGLRLEKDSLVSSLSNAEEKMARLREARERLATEYALESTASQERLKATGAEEAWKESSETSATSSSGSLLKRVASRIPRIRRLRRPGDT
ncbi:hypothetical protein FRB97_001955, partial [Tulasnella sp. 331]